MNSCSTAQLSMTFPFLKQIFKYEKGNKEKGELMLLMDSWWLVHKVVYMVISTRIIQDTLNPQIFWLANKE